MALIIFLVGFFGIIGFTVITIINKATYKPKNKELVRVIICFILFISSFIIVARPSNSNEKSFKTNNGVNDSIRENEDTDFLERAID